MTDPSARSSSMVWPTIMTVPALIVLVMLGFWQLDRMGEKRAMITGIENALEASPVDFLARVSNPDSWHWRAVSATGHFDHDREVFLYAPNRDGAPGYHVLTPLIREDGVALLVDRGWVPPDHQDPATRRDGQISGTVTVTGVTRRPSPAGLFTPQPSPDDRLWFNVDITAIGDLMGIALAPVILEVDDTPGPGRYPVGGQTRIDIPDNHLDYALTWFGLAVVLAVIYVVYWRRRR